MIRLVFFAAILVTIYFIVKKLLQPSAFVRCGRCEGKGFRYSAREKVICDWWLSTFCTLYIFYIYGKSI